MINSMRVYYFKKCLLRDDVGNVALLQVHVTLCART